MTYVSDSGLSTSSSPVIDFNLVLTALCSFIVGARRGMLATIHDLKYE